jgi:hypothetical protein
MSKFIKKWEWSIPKIFCIWMTLHTKNYKHQMKLFFNCKINRLMMHESTRSTKHHLRMRYKW